MKFIDAPIFIKWLAASKKMLSIESAISGYILYKIETAEPAITTTLVKDEVLIWLSRYKASALSKFVKALRLYYKLNMVQPTISDQELACKLFGKYKLGISDLINLSVMKRLKIREIYSTDTRFKDAGIKVIFHELQKEKEFKIFIDLLVEKGFSPSF